MKRRGFLWGLLERSPHAPRAFERSKRLVDRYVDDISVSEVIDYLSIRLAGSHKKIYNRLVKVGAVCYNKGNKHPPKNTHEVAYEIRI